MKIIHCGDIHLGSAMESKFPPEKAKERQAELVTAFKKIADYASENDAKAVMICGDLFDSAKVPKKISRYITDLIKSKPETDFLYIAGNHDPSGFCLSGDEECPENLIIFPKDRWQSKRYGKTVITGISYDREPHPPLPELSESDINIVMLHGDISKTDPKDDGIDLRDYQGKGIDLLALGHIHSFALSELDKRGICCYCGCPEGRGFDEGGEKGFVEITANDGECQNENKLSLRFVKAAKRTIHIVKADISDCISVFDIENAVRKATQDIPETDIVRVILEGSCSVETRKDSSQIEKIFENSFYLFNLKDSSRLKLNPDDYKNDISLKGEFIRLAAGENLDPEERDLVISLGLCALRGEEPD